MQEKECTVVSHQELRTAGAACRSSWDGRYADGRRGVPAWGPQPRWGMQDVQLRETSGQFLKKMSMYLPMLVSSSQENRGNAQVEAGTGVPAAVS